MRILITNIQLDHRTGTEIVVRDLEHALRQRGHDVCVYTPRPGILADEIRARGGRVVSRLADVPFRPDVLHGHHTPTAAEAAVHFADVPMVFVCHSRNFWIDMARGVPSVSRFVAVDHSCRERLLAEGVDPSIISVITNAVDLERFRTRSEPVTVVRRAALFGNNARHAGFAAVVRRACERLDIELDEFGAGVGRTLHEPEQVLAGYDVVFAKARCAIEAMSAGCAVIAVDDAGYGGLVTAHDVDWMLDWNVGDRTLQRRHDVDAVVADLQRVAGSDVAATSARVRERCDVRAAAAAYEALYMEATRPGGAEAVAASWSAAHRDLAEHADELERRLRASIGPWSMPALPESVAGAVHVEVRRAPREMEPGREFLVEVTIDNRTREQLASVGATPVVLSYHWLDACTGAISVFEGRRTGLSRPVLPASSHHQEMTVDAPTTPGRHTLRVTLVQEHVRWFSTLPVPVVADRPILVAAPRSAWRLEEATQLAGLLTVVDAPLTDLGFVSSPIAGMLTFANDVSFLGRAIGAGCGAVIVPPDLVAAVPDGIGIVQSTSPPLAFQQLHTALADLTDFYGADEPTTIDPSARIHRSAVVDPTNVFVGPEVEIGPACVLTGRVAIGAGVRVEAGSVIGALGFQTLRSGEQLVEIPHVGTVEIEARAVVFANATVGRGLFRQRTVIATSARIGNNAFVSHNCRIGARTMVGHGATVNGNVHVGDDVWIGPNATVANNLTIGDRARVDLGATVIGHLQPDEHVGGPPAIEHRTILREVAAWRTRGRRR